jgi:hypothetical protein
MNREMGYLLVISKNSLTRVIILSKASPIRIPPVLDRLMTTDQKDRS